MTKETFQYIGDIHKAQCIPHNPEIILECDATLIQEHSCIQAHERDGNWQNIKRPASTGSNVQNTNKYRNGEAPWNALAAVQGPKYSSNNAGMIVDSCRQGSDLVVEKGSGKEEANS